MREDSDVCLITIYKPGSSIGEEPG